MAAFKATAYSLNDEAYLHQKGRLPELEGMGYIALTFCPSTCKLYILGGDRKDSHDHHISFDLRTKSIQEEAQEPHQISHTATFCVENNIFVFGGYSYTKGSRFKDFHTYNVISKKWKEVMPLNEIPIPEISAHQMVYDNCTQTAYLLYGYAGNNTFNYPVYSFHVPTNKWEAIPAVSSADVHPGNRTVAGTHLYKGRYIILFGGNHYTNFISRFDLDKKIWETLEKSPPSGSPYCEGTCSVLWKDDLYIWSRSVLQRYNLLTKKWDFDLKAFPAGAIKASRVHASNATLAIVPGSTSDHVNMYFYTDANELCEVTIDIIPKTTKILDILTKCQLCDITCITAYQHY